MIYEWECPKCNYVKKSFDYIRGWVFCPFCSSIMIEIKKIILNKNWKCIY